MNETALFHQGSRNIMPFSDFENSKGFPLDSRKHKVNTEKNEFFFFHLNLEYHRKRKKTQKLNLFDP